MVAEECVGGQLLPIIASRIVFTVPSIRRLHSMLKVIRVGAHLSAHIPYTIGQCTPLCTRQLKGKTAAVPARTQNAEATIIGRDGCVAGGVGTALVPFTANALRPHTPEARGDGRASQANRQVCVRASGSARARLASTKTGGAQLYNARRRLSV